MCRSIVTGITAALIFVVVGVVWLSASMETLDVVAEHLGVEERVLWSPFLLDYMIPGLEESLGATLILGMASTFLVLGVAYGVGRALLVKRGRKVSA